MISVVPLSEKNTKGETDMKKFLNEFKEFALRGNVMDLAIGVIIGGAFKSITDSLVNDMLSPILGLFAQDGLKGLSFPIFNATVNIGSFIMAIINFVIMAFLIFLLVKGMNFIASLGNRKKVEEPEEPTTQVCPFCISEIDIKATRCPHCTSVIETVEEIEMNE